MKSRLRLAVLALLAIGAWLAWRADWITSSPSVDSRPQADDGSSALSRAALPVDPDANASEPTLRIQLPTPARRIVLALRRFPDDVPLRAVQVQVDPSEPKDVWSNTDDRGRVEWTVPDSTATIRIRAAGYEPLEAVLGPQSTVVEKALTPSWGLFGRVVDVAGKAAVGIDVAGVRRSRFVEALQRATRSHPEVQLGEESSELGTARTNGEGFFYLGVETRFPGSRITIAARSHEGPAASLDVLLPSPPELLPDLVLAGAEILRVRVVDEARAPLAGVTVFSADWSVKTTSGSDGTCAIQCPLLPTRFDARLAGWKRKEIRLDGVAVPPLTPVETIGTVVEIGMALQPGWAIDVVDAETKLAITTRVSGEATFLLHEQELGSANFEFDWGRSFIPFTIEGGQRDLQDLPDNLQLSLTGTGYRDYSKSIAITPETNRSPLQVALDPDPDCGCLRGRALRAGEPVAGLQVGLGVRRRNATKSWDYVRGYSAADGRFVLRWKMHADDVVVVHPHWKRWDEYGFLGPLSAEEANAGEHVLELSASVPVPAILHNVVRSDRYRYYVALVDGELAFTTTINGAPLTIDADGDARTTLLLPSDRKARVTIGYSGEDFYHPNASSPVDYDPANRAQPLVFELPDLFAKVSGHVAGLSDAELSRASVGLTGSGEQSARLVRVGSSGAFEFPNVLLGGAQLRLFLEDEVGRTSLVSILPLHVEDKLEGLLLSKDPNSLPADAARGN